MIFYRHCDPRFPFLWESNQQPAARWHGPGQGPVQYLADTPDGAWAELMRHEGISSEEDLEGVERDLWAVDMPLASLTTIEPELPLSVLLGGLDSYPACRAEALRLRGTGIKTFIAPSA